MDDDDDDEDDDDEDGFGGGSKQNAESDDPVERELLQQRKRNFSHEQTFFTRENPCLFLVLSPCVVIRARTHTHILSTRIRR